MFRIRVAILAITLVGTFANAQTNRGSISGDVKDPSGALIPGAVVTVINEGTNEVRKAVTTDLGAFSVPDLDPVSYRVMIEAKGFKKEVLQGVKVDTSSVASVHVTLQTGSVSESVEVSAQALSVNTENGTTSGTITQREIREAPLVNRSVLDLALTLPNVTGSAGTENPSIVTTTTCPGCNISVNGGRPLNTLMVADGVNNTGVSLARAMVSFTPEDVQEFTVLTSAYSAEYGQTGGGVIMTTTKSGTNEFHGLAMWVNRNPYFGASPWSVGTANRPVATLKYNQAHFDFGGPVWIPKIYNGRSRTFFYAAFEPDWRRDRLDQYGLVPTDAMRQGNFSGLVNTTNSGWLPASVVQQFQSIAPNAVAPAGDNNIYQVYNLVANNQFVQNAVPSTGQTYQVFPNNTIPTALLDSSALKSLKYIVEPGPYYLDSNGHISNIYDPRLLTQNEKRYIIRVDHVFSEKDRIFGRYTTSPIIKDQLTPVSVTTDAAEYSYARQAMLAWTHTLSPTMFNDLRLNYTRGRFSTTTAPQYDAQTGANLNTELGLPNITKGGVPLFNGLFPGSSFGGGGSQGTGLGSGGSTSLDDKEERYAVTDIYYWSHRNMTWKFGFETSKSLENVIPLFGALGGSYTFSNIQTDSNAASNGSGGAPFASYLLGVPNGNVTLRNTEVPYYYRWWYYAGFVQNDWRIRPNLTLNLGLRYNVEMPRTEKYNNQGFFDLSQSTSVNLATPLTLQDGEVVKSTMIPAFAFAGRGGVSKYLTPTDYLDFEPRFGFAWSPEALQAHHVTIRGGYGISHAPVTGAFRLPLPDFGATASFTPGGLSVASNGTQTLTQSTTANPNNIMRLGENPPLLTPASVAQVVGAPSNGVITMNSLYYQQAIGGFAISQNYHTPYIQNWDMTVSWQASRDTVVEVAYVGNKGTHLFMGAEDVNPKDVNLILAQSAQNVSSTGTINDPLGRINPVTGKILTVQNGSLGSPYLGFSSLNVMFDASGDSIRHAGYVSVQHRVGAGLSFSANYNYAKSIDDASSAGGDKNVLSAVNGQVAGQVVFGASRQDDRAVSLYDQRHVINGTYVYDLPIGEGRRFASHLPKVIDYVVGGWSTAGIVRAYSGFPMVATLSDSNQLGDATHTARPNIVPGVPLINPLWSSTCPVGIGCEPYLNPQAFERPAFGQFGNAPRDFDSVRGPWGQTFDLNVHKKFALGHGEKRFLEFRADFLNVLNHPVFSVFPNNAGGTDIFGAPTTANPSTAEYNTWASANAQPLQSTPAGAAEYNAIIANINSFRTGGTASGGLPANFFAVPPAANFYGIQANSFDIRTIDGYKQYRLRQQFATSSNSGGDLYQSGSARYIQFGLKLYF